MASKLCKLRFLSIKAITLIVLDHQHCLRTYTVFAHGNAQGVYIGYRQVLGGGRLHECSARKFEYQYLFYGLPPCFTSSRARPTVIMMSSQHVLLLTCTLPGHNYILEHAVIFSTTKPKKKHLLTIIYLNNVLISSMLIYKTCWPVQSSLRVTGHHHLIQTHH